MSHVSPAEELQLLEARINAILPPRYVGCFEDVSPSSMGSAKLRYDTQGRIAWGEIWTTFCHLALAGGPPHRGRLLGAVTEEETEREPEQYQRVVAELNRALGLCVELPLLESSPRGWIGLQCAAPATAAWLVRAIIAENVMARHAGAALYVPAGPHFRDEKEIKNVVVAVAKTCHYLFDHLEPEQVPQGEAPPLVRPLLPHELAALGARYTESATALQQRLAAATGRKCWPSDPPGWIGVECGDEESAVWLMRAVAAADILVRREETALYLPVDISHSGALTRTAAALEMAQRLSRLRSP